MSITLSPEQINYVKASGKVILNACPGSGKTTTIAHKLFELIQSWEKRYLRHAGILCLSFTNVAKNEISQKFKEINGFPLAKPHIISTIDSFVNSFITLPFAPSLKDIGKRYRIVDDMAYLNRIFTTNWKFNKEYGTLMHRFDPSKLDYTLTNSISWDGIDKSEDDVFVKYGKELKAYQMSLGLLKTSDSAFLAYHILRKFPRLAKYLGTKFPHLIVDEAQDTSRIQHMILEMLYNGGLGHIDLVGDPYQCLYQWRDASPEVFLEKFDDKENWKGLFLTENRRSTKRIIDVFGTLRRLSDQPIVAVNNSEADLPLHLIRCDPANYGGAIGEYERLIGESGFRANSILVRGNKLKNSLLGREHNYSPWNSSVAHLLIESRIHLASNEVKEAITKSRRVIIELCNPGINFSLLKEKEEDLRKDKDTNALIFRLIREIPDFSLSIREWTIMTQQYLMEKLRLTTEPDFKLRKNSTSKFDKNTLNNPINRYFRKSTTDSNLPISTIHQVKGMTFDSIFLILSPDSKGQNISLNDFVLKTAMPTEKQRLIYVAISRPRSLLCIGVPDSACDEVLKSQFGNDVRIL